MKDNRKLFIGFILGILLAGGFSLFFLDKSYKRQIQHQRLQISAQAAFIDSIRSGNLITLMTNVVNQIDEELKGNTNRILSDGTIASISALSYSFKPYRYTQGDSLSTKKLSPERGQLLLLLSGMHLDSGSLHKIMIRTSFAGADLRAGDLKGMDLTGVDLKGADLQDANLEGADLMESNLGSVNLWGAHMRNANLSGADLNKANLSWADLNGADLSRTNLNEIDMISAQVRQGNLSGATIKWADLTGSFFNEANLSGTDLFRTKLKRTQLVSSIFTNANMTLANLGEANLTGANFSNAEMTQVILSEKNWLTFLDEWKVTGAKEIQNEYKIADGSTDPQAPYHLEKIKK